MTNKVSTTLALTIIRDMLSALDISVRDDITPDMIANPEGEEFATLLTEYGVADKLSGNVSVTHVSAEVFSRMSKIEQIKHLRLAINGLGLHHAHEAVKCADSDINKAVTMAYRFHSGVERAPLATDRGHL